VPILDDLNNTRNFELLSATLLRFQAPDDFQLMISRTSTPQAPSHLRTRAEPLSVRARARTLPGCQPSFFQHTSPTPRQRKTPTPDWPVRRARDTRSDDHASSEALGVLSSRARCFSVFGS
jgi:hypothetical protein